MSSGTSTEEVRVKPDAKSGAEPDTTQGIRRRRAGHEKPKRADSGLEPWQFFVLAALGSATAALFASRGQGLTTVVLLTVLMATAALVGMAALRTVRPLVSGEDDRTMMVGQRTRASLEREKMLALRAIKELEFDRAMGKLSDADWNEMSGRLRARAARLIRQLDAGANYREQIEQDLTKRLEQIPARPKDSTPARPVPDVRGEVGVATADPAVAPICAACATENDADARFCKACGQRL
jgi:hypothetical protein